MNKPSLIDRIRYAFDNITAKGTANRQRTKGPVLYPVFSLAPPAYGGVFSLLETRRVFKQGVFNEFVAVVDSLSRVTCRKTLRV